MVLGNGFACVYGREGRKDGGMTCFLEAIQQLSIWGAESKCLLCAGAGVVASSSSKGGSGICGHGLTEAQKLQEITTFCRGGEKAQMASLWG